MAKVNEPDEAILSARPDGWIRLGCVYCDRDDHDFIKKLPTNWHRICPVQTWEEAIRPPKDDESGSLDWETHRGVCPECFQSELNSDGALTMKKFSDDSSSLEQPGNLIRLGCAYCDRDDFDGVAQLPTDWYCLSPVEMVAGMILPVTEEEGDLLTWETHLGICPECFENDGGKDFCDRKFRCRERKVQP